MKRLLLPLLAALSLPTAVNAGVDPAVHNLCLPAADYIGCVKAQFGISNQMRKTVDQGVALSIQQNYKQSPYRRGLNPRGVYRL